MEGRTFARTTNFGGRAMTEKLLNCPFCGGAAQSFEAPSVEGWHHVGCGPCQATSGCRQTEAEAIAAWNARPGGDARDTAITEAIQALIDAGDYFSARADVNDGDYGVPSPNREMTLASQCDEALERLEALRARAQMEMGE